ncbi:nuclease-related domain-containing protein [Macrococcus equi]|uniref:nuclease-related domain-containing protein n=1 Tax=Macrococcus equi TaxID=3395462 RepID=UPI0039BDDE64
MFLKIATKSLQLVYLEELHGRILLTEMDRRKYFNLNLGYEGEEKVYEYLNNNCKGVCIWDIRLDLSGEIQYDFLIIINGYIFILEIKNWYGHYTYSDGNFKSQSGFVNREVFSQAANARDKLEVFCYEQNINHKIINEVVFVNDTFKVINNVPDIKINSMELIKELTKFINQFDVSEEDILLGKLLIRYHINKSKNEQFNYYPYEKMKRGLKCPKCRRFLKHERNAKKNIRCECGYKMKKSEAIIEAFSKIEMLKREAVSASEVGEWLDISGARIRKVLSNHCITVGMNKNRKYKSKDNWLR